jgi:hypothetical protein
MTAKKQLFYAKAYLLTAPNMDTESPPQAFLDVLCAHPMERTLQTAIVAKEKHKSGVPHFHALLVFQKRKALYKNDSFNFIFGKQVNIQSVKSLQDAADYVTKAGDYASHGAPLLLKKKKTKKATDYRAKVIDFLHDEHNNLSDLHSISSPEVNAVLYNDASKLEKW